MERSKLRTIVKVLKRFQELDMEMQIPTILTFLEVAMWDEKYPPSIMTLGKKIGAKATAASGSRNVMAFCKSNRVRKHGYDMMETRENPEYRVEKLIFMKQKGELFADSLVDLMTEN